MGKKRKGDDSWQLDQKELAFAQRLYTPEQKKVKKSVQEEITEAKYNVKDWYPIYSDTVGGWQADLMFLNVKLGKTENYREHCLLCVININSKYAFVKELPFTPQKNKDSAWRPTTKKVYKVPGTAKSSAKVRDAMMKILQDMREEQQYLRFQAPGANPHATFKVKVIYTDDGGEFKGDFQRWCQEKEIRQVRFQPLTGKKTRMGVVERFNRTFRRYYEVYLKTHPETPKKLNVLIPEIMKEYNREKDHKSIRNFWRRNVPSNRRMRASGGTKGNPISLKFTPMMMMLKGKQTEWMDYKRKQTDKVDSVYAKKITQLQQKPTVRYWKKLILKKKGAKNDVEGEEQFAKSGSGTLTKPVQVLRQHTYMNKSQKEPVKTLGKSFVVGSGEHAGLKLLPYDLVVK